MAVNDSVNFVMETAQKALDKSERNEKLITTLQEENSELHSKVDYLTERVIKLESYGRQENLLLHGIPETSSENCEALVLQALTEAGIKLGSDRPFVRVHPNPPGPPRKNGMRPIIVCFHHFQDRMMMWHQRSKLKEGLHVTEDFLKEIQARRRQLAPYLALAKSLNSVRKCKLIFVIDSKSYSEEQPSYATQGVQP